MTSTLEEDFINQTFKFVNLALKPNTNTNYNLNDFFNLLFSTLSHHQQCILFFANESGKLIWSKFINFEFEFDLFNQWIAKCAKDVAWKVEDILQLVEYTSCRFRLWWVNHFQNTTGLQLLNDIIKSNSFPQSSLPATSIFGAPTTQTSMHKTISKPLLEDEDEDYDNDSEEEPEPEPKPKPSNLSTNGNLTNGNHSQIKTNQQTSDAEGEPNLSFSFSKYEYCKFNPLKIPVNSVYQIFENNDLNNKYNDIQQLDRLRDELYIKLNQTNQLGNHSMNGDNNSGLPLSLNSDSLNSMPEFDDQSSGMKFLWSKICSNRRLTNLNDRELRSLLNEVKPNRGKWFSYEKPNQEKLYTAMESAWKALNDSGENAKPFQFKVSKKDAPDYFRVIKNPMDFDTIHTKMKNLQYQSKQQFLDDIELIYSNCFQYNTQPNHYLRKCATAMRKKTEQLSGSIPDIDLSVDDGNKSFLIPDDDDDGDRSVLFSDRGAVTPRSNILSAMSVNLNNNLEDDSVSTNGHNSDHKSVEDAQTQLNSLETSIHRINQIDLSKRNVDEIMYHLLTRRLTKKMRVFLDHCIQDRVPDLTNFMMNWIQENQNGFSSRQKITHINSLDHSGLLDNEADYIEGLIIPYAPKSNLESVIPKAKTIENDSRVFGVIDKSCQSSPQNGSSSSNEGSNSNEMNTWLDPDLLGVNDIDLLKLFPELNPGPNVSELPTFQSPNIETLNDFDSTSKTKFTSYENYTKAKPIRHGNANSIFSNLEVLKRNRQLYNQIVMVRQFRAEEALQWLNQNNNEGGSTQPEFKAPINISNESPFIDTSSARSLTQRFALILLSHAGFESAEPCALEVFTEIVVEYMANIGKTLMAYLDNHSQTMSFEEIFLHTLYENGIPNLGCLENHYKYDVEKYGGRLKEVNRKLETALQNILTEPPEDLVTEDGDLKLEQNEESFLSGGLGEITGEDFFGFKDLGLDVMTVPTRLILGRKKHVAPQVQEASVEPELEFPPCPPFSPISSPGKQIGLLRQYFEDKLTDPDPQAKLEDEEVPSRSRYKLKVPPIGRAGLSQRKRIAEAAIIADQKRLKKRQETEIRTLKKQKTEEEKIARAQAKLEQKQQREKEKQQAAAAKAEAKKKAAEIQAEKKATREAEKATSGTVSGAQPSVSTPLEEVQEDSPEPEEEFTSSTSASSIAADSQSDVSDSATSSDEDANPSHNPSSKGYHPPLPKIKINLNRISNAISPSVSYEPNSKPKQSSTKHHNNFKSTSSRQSKNYSNNSNVPYYDSTTSSSAASISGDTSSTSEDEFTASNQFSGHGSSKNHINSSSSRGYKAPPGTNHSKSKFSGGSKVLGKRSGPSNSQDTKKRR